MRREEERKEEEKNSKTGETVKDKEENRKRSMLTIRMKRRKRGVGKEQEKVYEMS